MIQHPVSVAVDDAARKARLHCPHDLTRSRCPLEGRLPPLRRQGRRRSPPLWSLEPFALGLPVKLSEAEALMAKLAPTRNPLAGVQPGYRPGRRLEPRLSGSASCRRADAPSMRKYPSLCNTEGHDGTMRQTRVPEGRRSFQSHRIPGRTRLTFPTRPSTSLGRRAAARRQAPAVRRAGGRASGLPKIECRSVA